MRRVIRNTSKVHNGGNNRGSRYVEITDPRNFMVLWKLCG